MKKIRIFSDVFETYITCSFCLIKKRRNLPPESDSRFRPCRAWWCLLCSESSTRSATPFASRPRSKSVSRRTHSHRPRFRILKISWLKMSLLGFRKSLIEKKWSLNSVLLAVIKVKKRFSYPPNTALHCYRQVERSGGRSNLKYFIYSWLILFSLNLKQWKYLAWYLLFLFFPNTFSEKELTIIFTFSNKN